MKKKNEDLKLEVISSIEPEIIDEVSNKRAKLSAKLEKGSGFFSKKKLIMVGSIAASVVIICSLIFGVILPMLGRTPGVMSNGKQIPIYQGMSVSSDFPSTVSNDSIEFSYLSGKAFDISLLSNNNTEGNNGNHGSNDENGNNKDKDKHTPVDVDKVVEENYESSLKVNGAAEGLYYAKPNTEVYITVHLSNPDQFEILSFTLNGYKYQSYQFENGSDSENLILKVKIGDVAGISKYTIDAIKYIDGTETKDARMDGDKTVTIGVHTNNQLVPKVENEHIGFNDISFDLSVEDIYSLVTFSEGKIQAVLCDGDSIINTKDIVLGEKNSVKFEGLTTDAQYGYAIIATYDSFDGDGINSYTIYKKAFKTKSIVDFDNTAATKDGLTFDIVKAEAYKNMPIDSITVYKGDEKVKDIDVSAKAVTGLLSNTEYTIIIGYTNNGNPEVTEYVFKTLEKTVPSFEIKPSEPGQTNVGFDISENDPDDVGEVIKIELIKGDNATAAENTGIREFNGLLSNNDYTIKVTYKYDLNDGVGAQEIVKSVEIKTKAKATPSIAITNTETTQTGVKFDVSETDTDNIGEISKIELIKGDNVTAAENTGVREFNGLLSNNDYTIKVTYKYDLNDGVGDRETVKSVNVKTKAKSAPTVGIVSVEKTKDSVSFGITKTDIDLILNITSIKIGDGKGTVKEFSVADSVFSINGLVPNTEYKISVEYEYDLNDGKGIQKKAVNNTVYTEPIVKVISSKCINTTAISKGDTIVLRITTEDIGNAKITSAKVNGIAYSISELSTSTSTIIEIVYSNQFEGGDTELILEELTVLAYGDSYTLEIGANNKTSCFVYGDFDVESIALTDETGKPVEYLMPSDQAYYYIKLQNSTGYEVVGVELLNMIYTQYVTFGKDSIKMLDNDTLMIPFDHTVRSEGYGEKYYRLKSVTFINASGEKETRIVETVPNNNIYYVVLEKDGIVEISKPEDLKKMGKAAYYKLMCDIDLSDLSWDAPGEFRGYFDGNGHTISGMTVVKTYTDQSATLGLFSYADGIIKDLNIKDTFIIVTVKNERLYYGCIAGRGTPILRNVTVSGSSQFTVSEYGLAQYINDGNVNIGETILVNKKQVKYSAMDSLAYNYNHFNNWELTTDAEKYQTKFSFEVNGGEPIADRFSVYLGNIIPKKDLHMFLGWYDNAEFEGAPLSPSYRTGENVKVYAKWVYTGINENQGLEMSEDGYIIGIGTCTDKVLVLNAPIRVYAFENCKQIEKVFIGPKVTVIGEGAFTGCTGLKEVVMADGIKIVVSAAFRGCTSLEKINLPDTIIEFHSSRLFCGCENLKEIVLPNGITEIGERAFEGCTSLESIKIPSTVKTISWGAFSRSGLKEISLPEGITVIEANTFSFCKSLESVELPSTIVSIGDAAFAGCDNLKNIELPEKLTEIGTDTFNGCKSLTNVSIPNGIAKIGVGAFAYCVGLTDVTIPSSITGIEESTFRDCKGLTSISVPNSVTSIGNSAFAGCTGLTSINIPNGVKSIGNHAFSGCTSLTSINIPDGVTRIEDSTFSGCVGLTAINIPLGVTSIGAGAFGSSGLKEITVPGKVTQIGDEAFYMCTSLQKVVLSEGLEKIGQSAFGDCSFENFTIPSTVKEIGAGAFRSCEALTAIVLPNGITRIEPETFVHCYALESVFIPQSVTFIGGSAFYECRALESIELPDALRSIGAVAFYGCESLTTITLPRNVTRIEQDTFTNCYNLKEIFIEGDLKFIGEQAFANCHAFESIIIPATVTEIKQNAFVNCTNLTIYVESASKPDGWHTQWNSHSCPVIWGYKEQ